ncbi:MAG: hypothetical protein B7Z66_12070 [Chromatiales bacterium 21-64-14]|nr:MAG: hypothetical protein B7Z66_12070 [Chromatiales bacterium 21-64-14]
MRSLRLPILGARLLLPHVAASVNAVALKDRLQSLAARVDALSLRERALLLAALLVVVYVLWANLLMAPLGQRQKTQQGQVAQINTRIATQRRQGIARHRESGDKDGRLVIVSPDSGQ